MNIIEYIMFFLLYHQLHLKYARYMSGHQIWRNSIISIKFIVYLIHGNIRHSCGDPTDLSFQQEMITCISITNLKTLVVINIFLRHMLYQYKSHCAIIFYWNHCSILKLKWLSTNVSSIIPSHTSIKYYIGFLLLNFI